MVWSAPPPPGGVVCVWLLLYNNNNNKIKRDHIFRCKNENHVYKTPNNHDDNNKCRQESLISNHKNTMVL